MATPPTAKAAIQLTHQSINISNQLGRNIIVEFHQHQLASQLCYD